MQPFYCHFSFLKCIYTHIYCSSAFFSMWHLNLCASFCQCAFSSEMGTAEGWVQRCWVFYQMDTQYESRLSFSQGLNVCVGLHIAYLETTQDP